MPGKRDLGIVRREYTRAMVHIRFCMELYTLQMNSGRYFLHEHPAQASSWEEKVVRKVSGMGEVRVVVGDQCQYNAQDRRGAPIKKPTKFMTNSPAIAEQLEKRCRGRLGLCSRPSGGSHALCNGRTAKEAAMYLFDLCRAILRDFRNQMLIDGRMGRGELA